jgi:hypothetical protein
LKLVSHHGAAAFSGGFTNNRMKSTGIFLIPLIALAAIYTVGLSIAMKTRRFDLPEKSKGFYALFFSLFIIWWVGIDRRRRGLSVPFDFDFLVYLTWPFMIPYYLFRTRGRMGIFYALVLFGLYIAPTVVAALFAVFYFR